MFRKPRLACSFCQRSHTEVEKLVAGPRVFICDRCAAIAVDIMRSDYTPPAAPSPERLSLLVRIGNTIRRFIGKMHRGAVIRGATVSAE
jgi:ATP-dependent protease Clp ATPase subunit